MKPQPSASSFVALLLFAALIVVAAGATSSIAQEGDPAPPPPDSASAETPRSLEPAPPPPAVDETKPAAGANPYVPGRPAFTWGDSTGLVLPPLADVRAKSELELDAQVSRTLRGSAETRMLKARERTLQWKSQIEMQKARITALDKEIDAAKKEKREADKKELEAEKKYENRVRDYFQAMSSALEAEAEAHRAAFDYTQSRITEVDLEQRLGTLWSEGYESRISVESRDLERQVLLAVKDRATKMANYAAREKTAADRRLEALKIWAEVQPR